MLLFHASLIVGTILVVSARHDIDVEPDYYAKAVDWDEEHAQLDAANNMGWTIEITAARSETSPDRILAVTITDRDNAPITGALVEAQCLQPAFASNQLSAVLIDEHDTGIYAKLLPIHTPGFWRVNLSIRAQGVKAIVRREITIVGDSARSDFP